MNKHTPGPWSWGENHSGLYGAGKDNEVLAHASYEGMWLAYGKSHEANARLIAAAPDLLEALQRALNVLDATGAKDEANTARAAIAKALGEQP